MRVGLDTVFDISAPDVIPPTFVHRQLARAPEGRPGGTTSYLVLLVNERGKVVTVRIEPSGAEIRDSLLLAAAKAWTFRPATKDGVPVSYCCECPSPKCGDDCANAVRRPRLVVEQRDAGRRRVEGRSEPWRAVGQQLEELHPRACVVAERAQHRAGHGVRVLLLDAAHRHAQVRALADHRDTERVEYLRMVSAIWLVKRSCSCRSSGEDVDQGAGSC